MNINANYVVVERVEEEKREGFETVEVQDNFVCKGKVKYTPDTSVYIGNEVVTKGSIILFAKYSPDTHEQDIEGKKVKFVKTSDILAIL